MSISYTEVASSGDPLPNNRHTLYFPDLPSIVTGKDLTLRHTNVSMPPLQVGQIIVKQLGWSLAFAGLRTQQNTFTCEFVETYDAKVIRQLAQWQDICSGMRSHLARLKTDCAVKAQCIAYDTTNKKALTVNLFNVWPMNITWGQFAEESTASLVNVDFSVDAIEFAQVTTTDQDFELPSSASANNSAPLSAPLWYQSQSGADQVGGNGTINFGSYSVSDQVVRSLGLTPQNVPQGLQNFF